MKITIAFFLSLMLTSCINTEFEQKKSAMIKPSIFNAINFTDDFNRESKYFDPKLQRQSNLVSIVANTFLSFSYKPDTMPTATPAPLLRIYWNGGASSTAASPTIITELTDSYIFTFNLSAVIGLAIVADAEAFSKNEDCYFLAYTQVDAETDYHYVYSEICTFVPAANLTSESIATIIAYNNDLTHGFLNSTYPSCGFFEFSELNSNVFGNSKVEYAYSYGRRKILNSENFIKTRITFHNLSMYQQNLLKTLCNCENVFINSVQYYLVSDFTEKNKSDDSEICDLTAEFVPVESPTFFAVGASETPSAIKPTNLFMR